MDTMGATLSKMQTDGLSKRSLKPNGNGTLRRVEPDCPRCLGAGWLHRPIIQGDDIALQADGEHGRVTLMRCPSCNGMESRQEYLAEICGLNPGEIDTTFADCHRNDWAEAGQQIIDRHGWLTLHGGYGTGKTYLLTAIVNEARQAGHMAMYFTVAAILDHLRNAYKPGTEVDFDGLWRNVQRCEILCLDEIEKWSPTAWAEERFFAMIDDRYRDRGRFGTVLATNSLEDVPGYLKSRLMQKGAQFRTIHTGSKDKRRG